MVAEPTPEVLDALAYALRDSDEYVRDAVATALGRYGAIALPVALNALNSNLATQRQGATWALGAIGAEASEAVPALIACLEDSDAGVRSGAATALGLIGADAQEAVPPLLVALRGFYQTVRASAALALGRIGVASSDVVDALTVALRDDNSEVRLAAVEALGQLGQFGVDDVELAKSLIQAARSESDRDGCYSCYPSPGRRAQRCRCTRTRRGCAHVDRFGSDERSN